MDFYTTRGVAPGGQERECRFKRMNDHMRERFKQDPLCGVKVDAAFIINEAFSTENTKTPTAVTEGQVHKGRWLADISTVPHNMRYGKLKGLCGI